MIKTNELCKSFGSVKALDRLTLTIKENEVFGLVGTNGAGKSTLLRLIAGIFRQDSGSVTVDEETVWDNPAVKEKLFFLPDDPYFFPNGTAAEIGQYYRSVYRTFDPARYDRLLADFGLDPKRPVRGYSKGMRKQLAVLCGLSSGTRYLLCDETFDGLDPVMRQAVKTLFAGDMQERGLTPVIASHNLRELEDICDHVGLLHKGGLLLSQDLETMKLGIQKIQIVPEDQASLEDAFAALPVVRDERHGRLRTVIVRGEREKVLQTYKAVPSLYFEMVPLTLEEIFISETEVTGYDVKSIILGE